MAQCRLPSRSGRFRKILTDAAPLFNIMKKRLHDPGIWRKPWFRQLSKDAKLLWQYLCDECDCSGVWERDDKQAMFFLEIKELPFKELNKNLFFFCHQRKILIIDFCEFQYRLPEKFNEDSNLHKNILNRLNYHKLSFKIIDKLKKISTVGATVGATVNISISKSISINKSKNITFEPPTIKEVIKYFIDNSYPEELARRCYNGYAEAGWRDSKGNPVRSWKQKAQHVWFKPEAKTQRPSIDSQSLEEDAIFEKNLREEEKERQRRNVR